ncbi:DUF3054 domain-containing protein [Amnibacterium flavum]|uniref:DUF3054 domain-containing protein n=1 Tax=Amnibacterium flavum TaxID=2173173 RepID=A0A2V1HQA1_9MICO|nr:DUF3054 domain-containing protein [Amnibacterium flavum]PVZ94521.1 DUF3054 domain-containing protein [Amnibacterium flavum]
MPSRRSTVLTWLGDLVAVTAFVLIGRGSHDEGPAGIALTLVPFLVGLQSGWLLKGRGTPWLIRPGLIIWAGTVLVGLVTRAALGDGTPLSFIIVTTLVLAAFLLGWRAIAAWLRRLSRPRSEVPGVH